MEQIKKRCERDQAHPGRPQSHEVRVVVVRRPGAWQETFAGIWTGWRRLMIKQKAT